MIPAGILRNHFANPAHGLPVSTVPLAGPCPNSTWNHSGLDQTVSIPLDFEDDLACGRWMHGLASELFPLPRSITGNGVRETLRRVREELPGLTIHEVPSGTKVFDWTFGALVCSPRT